MSFGNHPVTGKENGKETCKENGKDSFANNCGKSDPELLYDVELLLAKKVPNRVSLVRVAEKAGSGSRRDDLEQASGPQCVADVLAACLKTHGPRRWKGCSPDEPHRWEAFLASLGSLQVSGLQEDGLLGWFREVAGDAGSPERLQALNLLILSQEALRNAVRRGHPVDLMVLRAVDRLGQEYGLVGRKILHITLSRAELQEILARQAQCEDEAPDEPAGA